MTLNILFPHQRQKICNCSWLNFHNWKLQIYFSCLWYPSQPPSTIPKISLFCFTCFCYKEKFIIFSIIFNYNLYLFSFFFFFFHKTKSTENQKPKKIKLSIFQPPTPPTPLSWTKFPRVYIIFDDKCTCNAKSNANSIQKQIKCLKPEQNLCLSKKYWKRKNI